MVKASNRAQQRRSLPSSRTTIKRGKQSAAKQAKQKVNNQQKKGIHFPNDQIAQDHIQTIIIEILTKWRQCEPKQKKNGEPPFGSLAKLVKQYSKTQQWLENGNKVKMKWRNMSDINKNRINLALPLVELNNNNNKTTVAPTSPTTVSGKSGRPIGTTNKAKQELTKKFSQMKNDIALSWVENKLLPTDHTNKMTLKQLIANKQHEYQLDPDTYRVASTTIYSRICRDRLEVKGTGMKSPMLDAEPLIVMYINQSTDCNDTMNQREIIDYANSYVSGTPVEDDVIAWKLRHQVDLRDRYIEHGIKPTSANLGKGWFDGFIRRWGKEVQYKGSSNVDFYRTEHCTYEKFVEMYDNVYGLLVKWGYAEVLEQPLYYNGNGEVCDIDDPNQYGEPVYHRFKHPELFMAADECGTNTNMSKDKMSAGNKKRCSTKGVMAKLPACTSDCHFTTMVWTKLDGNPAICLVIIEKDGELSYSELHGLDVNALWIGDDTMFNEIKNINNDLDKEKKMKEMLAGSVFSVELLQLNTGPGKVFPGGPICTVNGIEIPTVVRRSASGGITPEILVDVLKVYDALIPRVPGDPPPGAILDGHGSRLSPEFMRYINNRDEEGKVVAGANHKWNICLGLPNGTAYWQVGDSSEQNGMYKNLTREAKEVIRVDQRINCERIKISRHHVLLIMSKVFNRSFGNVEGNKKAILQRGWNPLNRGCLSHPEVLKSKKVTLSQQTQSQQTQSQQTLSQQTLSQLTVSDMSESQSESQIAMAATNRADPTRLAGMNVSEGKAQHYLSVLTTSTNRNVARERHHQEKKKLVQQQRLDNSDRSNLIDKFTGRLTSGGLTSQGHWGLGETTLSIVEGKTIAMLDKLAKKASKQYIRDMKTYISGKAAMEKSKHHYAAHAEGGVLYGVSNGPIRNKIVNGLRKASRWLLNDDYVDLIRYKQLGCVKQKSKIPNTLAERRVAWDSIYYIMNEPSPPVKPDNFITVVEANNDVEVEEIDIEALSRVNSDLPRTDASVEHFEAAQSLFTLTMTDECADSNYHGGQVWNTQISEI